MNDDLDKLRKSLEELKQLNEEIQSRLTMTEMAPGSLGKTIGFDSTSGRSEYEPDLDRRVVEVLDQWIPVRSSRPLTVEEVEEFDDLTPQEREELIYQEQGEAVGYMKFRGPKEDAEFCEAKTGLGLLAYELERMLELECSR